MQDEQVDLAVQLDGGGRWSNPFLRRVGARVTVGLRAPDAEPLDRNLSYVHLQHGSVAAPGWSSPAPRRSAR